MECLSGGAVRESFGNIVLSQKEMPIKKLCSPKLMRKGGRGSKKVHSTVSQDISSWLEGSSFSLAKLNASI